MQIINNGRKLSGRDNPEQSILGLLELHLHNTHLVLTSTGSLHIETNPHTYTSCITPTEIGWGILSLSHTFEPSWLYGGRSLNCLCFEEKGRNHWPSAKLAIFSRRRNIRLLSWSMLSLLASEKRSGSAYASSAVDQGRACAMNTENSL